MNNGPEKRGDGFEDCLSLALSHEGGTVRSYRKVVTDALSRVLEEIPDAYVEESQGVGGTYYRIGEQSFVSSIEEGTGTPDSLSVYQSKPTAETAVICRKVIDAIKAGLQQLSGVDAER